MSGGRISCRALTQPRDRRSLVSLPAPEPILSSLLTHPVAPVLGKMIRTPRSLLNIHKTDTWQEMCLWTFINTPFPLLIRQQWWSLIKPKEGTLWTPCECIKNSSNSSISDPLLSEKKRGKRVGKIKNLPRVKAFIITFSPAEERSQSLRSSLLSTCCNRCSTPTYLSNKPRSGSLQLIPNICFPRRKPASREKRQTSLWQKKKKTHLNMLNESFSI